jgi:hypothetical protein
LKNAELQQKIQTTPHETLYVLLVIWDTFWKVAIENEIFISKQRSFNKFSHLCQARVLYILNEVLSHV